MIYNRQEFRMWLAGRQPKFYKWESPPWSIEPKKYPSQWFVKVNPINVTQSSHNKSDYWDWCNNNLKGKLLCYWCDNDNHEEWWGFTNKDDILLWMLRWA